MAGSQYHMKFGPSAGAAVDDYLEYKRIVGDDDGGVLFTPEQYEAYKKRVTPMRINNRLFTSWTSAAGMDCKLIGPETPCFCGHRYHQHKTDFGTIPSERPIKLPCSCKGCRCRSYQFVPMNGTQPVRCHCKHFPEDHAFSAPNKCQNKGCSCSSYKTSYTCGCGEPAHSHTMVVETKEERLARGHPVGQDTLYKGMGGLTGFSSLMDGYMRLDPSGRGAPSKEFLEQPITASDHPFLRANVSSIKAHRTAIGAGGVDDDLAEAMSAMRRPGETDMEYFERRYQERLKAERQQARAARPVAAPRAVGIRKKPAVEGTSQLGVTGNTVSSAEKSTKAQRSAGRGEKKK